MRLDYPTFPRLIGFAGKMGSGKTTVSHWVVNYLNSVLDQNYRVESFATPLRNVVSSIIGIDIKTYKHNTVPVSDYIRNEFYYRVIQHIDKNNFSVPVEKIIDFKRKMNNVNVYNDMYRLLLQFVGTDVYRHCVDMDYWVKETAKLTDSKQVVFDDVRFKNETFFIKSNGGVVVYLITNDSNETFNPSHESENNITQSDCDFIFFNEKCNDPDVVKIVTRSFVKTLIDYLIEAS
jgi:anaerobic ribonucleoside-triphosphate reductase